MVTSGAATETMVLTEEAGDESSVVPLPTAQHETCTTVTTTTTEQVSTTSVGATNTGVVGADVTTTSGAEILLLQSRGNSPISSTGLVVGGGDPAIVDLSHVGVSSSSPGKMSPTSAAHHRITEEEVVESTLALSTEIVMSKNDDGDEADDIDDDAADENDEDDAADLDLELDFDTIDAVATDPNAADGDHEYQMIRVASSGVTSGSMSGISRKKSVFINEMVVDVGADRRSLYKANSAEAAKKRNSNGKNDPAASSNNQQRRQSTLQRLFKLKL